jgi:hypothetical protein
MQQRILAQALSAAFRARRDGRAEKRQGGSCDYRLACYGQEGKVFRTSKRLQ